MSGYFVIFYFISISLLNCTPVFSQTHEINRLESSLPSIKDSIKYIDALNRIAMLSHMNYRDSCGYYAQKAKEIAVRLNYSKGIADAYNCEGISNISVNNYLSAKYFNDALRIYKSIDDQENVCQLLMNIGLMMDVDKDEKEAIRYIYMAYEKSKSLKHDSIRSLIISNLIFIDPSLSKSKLKELFAQGKAIAEKYKDERLLLFYENTRGIELYNAGEKQRGIAVQIQTLNKADSLGLQNSKVDIYIGLGDTFLDLGNIETSTDYYKKALDTSRKYGYPELYIVSAEKLYNVYKSHQQLDKAYYYMSLLLAKRDTINKATNKSGYNYMNFALNENENEQLRIKESSNLKTITLLGCLFTLSMALVFLIYRSLRIKKQYGEAQHKLHEIALKQNTELQHTNRFNTMLISVIAHDIRQPFSNIVMLSSIFNTDIDLLTEQEKIEVMAELSETSQKSLSFMDGLLEWIKSQKNSFIYHPSKLILKDLIDEANAFFKIAQAKRNIQLILDIPEQTEIRAHQQMLLFIIRNILNNATKYSPEYGIIHISSDLTDQNIVIAIKDQGPGMNQEKVDQLFKANFNDWENTKDQGAGLALNISYEMALMMGVNIWATSAVGEGTTFYISWISKE
ncbi:signal transduction histidine kinase [Pedobacter cryoconitis]|uniref:histidine kinase n=1 Tax=Pedobacter cryoconitis TaxID=188932 RepID=A0A7W9E0N5_9SPHI|nr:HAMP domain-containing sensor histidine kinase [Pedobacter cryoconitis]MBB5638153.1 signal transduction histidine kinase [Pedobacter cryoconitis]